MTETLGTTNTAQNSAVYACTSNWLDANVPTSNLTATQANCVLTTGNSYWPNALSYYNPVYYSSPSRPIKLTLSEIERLRKAAKADDKLKAILSKFTSQIEITVDFE